MFSRYSKVIEADGSPMRVRTALGLINQTVDEVLSGHDSEYDSETRWAIAWFEQYAHNDASSGTAETLASAKAVSISGLSKAGIVHARGGKTRLLKREELAADWLPVNDNRVVVWEVTQHLITALTQRGEAGAAEIMRQVGGLADTARDLAYRLFSICERKGWAQEALSYNSLVVAWPEIAQLAKETPASEPTADQLFGWSCGRGSNRRQGGYRIGALT